MHYKQVNLFFNLNQKVFYLQLVQDQRDFFNSGATQSVEFRKAQLKKLREVVVQNKDAYVEAIYKDLRRPKPFCASEIDQVTSEYFIVELNLKNF